MFIFLSNVQTLLKLTFYVRNKRAVIDWPLLIK